MVEAEAQTIYPPDQHPSRFEPQIAAYEQRDRATPPIPNPVLFVGSSSFTRWTTLEEDFPELPAINRGFDGSNFEDLLYYMDRIVLPYRPIAILVYEGTNDVALGHTPQRVAANFRRFVHRVHAVLPKTHIHTLSGLIQPCRIALAPTMNAANDLVRQVVVEDPRLHYIDAQAAFMTPEGQPDNTLFEDTLHPNRKGYDRLIPIFRRALAAYATR